MPRKSQLKEESDNFRVSQSKVKTWRRCHRAYHLKYVEKLKAKRKVRALTFGSLVHSMIERYIEGDDPFEVLTEMDPNQMKLFQAEKDEYGAIIEDVSDIMTEYFAHWEADPMKYERIKGKSAEHSFDIEILPNVIWNGKIDARAKTNGLRWLVEHKTFKRRPSDDDRWRNLQSASYFRAMDMMGWKPVDGTCWDYIWSKPPNIPGILKDGSLSKKSTDTLPSTVVRAIKLNGLKTHGYREFLDKITENREKWFLRVYTRVDESARDLIFNDFIDTIKEIVTYHGKKSDMNIERHCSWCEYEPLCRAQLQGLDYDFIKERHYEKSAGRPEEEADHILSYEG